MKYFTEKNLRGPIGVTGSGKKDVPINSTPMVGIYNSMMNPSVPLNTSTYRYPDNRVNYSVDVGGVHMMYVNMWPDRAVQTWMDNDLAAVSPSTPVFLFTHCPIDPAEDKVFRNPAYPATFTSSYTGVIPYTVGTGAEYTSYTAAKDELMDWLGDHTQVQAYFAGHDNYSQFDTITTDGGILDFFRVDSPMKGKFSSVQTTEDPNVVDDLVSFDVFTIDTVAMTLTAREFLWNDGTADGSWGNVKTVSIATPDAGNTLSLGLISVAMLALLRRKASTVSIA